MTEETKRTDITGALERAAELLARKASECDRRMLRGARAYDADDRAGGGPMRIGSLFAGVGGLELGLEWAGVGHTVWQVEQDEYCRRVLARHWPNAERFTDVRDVGAHNLPPVDVLCGGFPCQDISDAGRRAGIDGARSGLWFEYARIIRELRPRLVVVENVRALLVRGLDRVLGSLAEAGYDAEWDVLSAAAVGAPHLRNRVFLIAWLAEMADAIGESAERYGSAGILAGESSGAKGQTQERQRRGYAPGRGSEALAHADKPRPQGRHSGIVQERAGQLTAGTRGALADANSIGRRRQRGEVERDTKNAGERRAGPGRYTAGGDSWWRVEPDVGRVAHGVPARVDRLRALGNAVVPQCAEVIGRRLLEIDATLTSRAQEGDAA